MSDISKKFTTEMYEATYFVEDTQDLMRLDQFIQIFLPSFSREQIKHKITKGEITIEGRTPPHRPSVKVHKGEKIQLVTYRGNLEDEYWNGEKLELELEPTIIYENNDYVAIGKPPYMTTHPSGKHLFNCATVYFETKYGHTMHSIHRIDRETSGVLLLGKNPSAAQKMTQLFEDDLVKKCYFFMAHKHKSNFPEEFWAKERMGSIDNYIPRLYVHCFDENSNDGKVAQTNFIKLEESSDYFLGLALPKTGRQHQIRAHAAFHGLPLIGDKLYNGDPSVFMRFKDGVATKTDHEKMQISRHALHAIALKLIHPDYPEIFRAPLPDDFKEWLQKNMTEINIEKLNLKINDLIKKLF